MFGWSRGPTPLEVTITNLHSDMLGCNPNTQEYDALLEQLERLYALQEKKKQNVSPDTKAIVIGNLVGILIIVMYERGNVMASKAKDWVIKPK